MSVLFHLCLDCCDPHVAGYEQADRQSCDGHHDRVGQEIEEVKEWYRHLRQMLSLKDDRDLPTYDGNILYFTAEDLSMDLKVIQMNLQELAQKKQDDLRSWCTYVPHINIYPVAAGHLTMFDEQFCDDYIAKIDNIVLPHNS